MFLLLLLMRFIWTAKLKLNCFLRHVHCKNFNFTWCSIKLPKHVTCSQSIENIKICVPIFLLFLNIQLIKTFSRMVDWKRYWDAINLRQPTASISATLSWFVVRALRLREGWATQFEASLPLFQRNAASASWLGTWRRCHLIGPWTWVAGSCVAYLSLPASSGNWWSSTWVTTTWAVYQPSCRAWRSCSCWLWILTASRNSRPLFAGCHSSTFFTWATTDCATSRGNWESSRNWTPCGWRLIASLFSLKWFVSFPI